MDAATSRVLPNSFAVGPSPYPFAVGDVNNDGLVGHRCHRQLRLGLPKRTLPLSRALTLLLSESKRWILPHQLHVRTGEPWFAAIADLNGDGRGDIVAIITNKVQ
jgi:hypothetical protein